ncbi:amino acid transporter [Lecanosticta acicola]|uniref:Amino acid transporter n=1 Tax=Lecanosticta acicola TaxID=111012 RepID=A0AAI8YSD9_9PEZI|nr:amino acid transporter [Lecanosticta acicola]
MRLITEVAAICVLIPSVVNGKPTAKRQAGCVSPVQRRSWTALDAQQKQAYLNAERCLQTSPARYGIAGATSLWDELQYVHVRQSSYIHGVGAFLPWHRYYTKLHEHLLQTHCGYRGGVPYWNEALDAPNILASPIWRDFGGNGAGPNRCVPDGPFSALRLRYNEEAQPGAEVCLSRELNAGNFADARQENVATCAGIPTFWEAADCYANLPHWAGHAGTGGIMADGMLAPGDPIFFMHHANLDRLYWEWQQAAPAERLHAIGGPNVPTAGFLQASGWPAPGPEFTSHSGDPAGETTLNHVLWMVGLLPNVSAGQVLDSRGAVICAEYV